MPSRRPLPDTRKSVTHTVTIYDEAGAGDCTLTLRVGFYPRGKPGELFVQVAKQGSTMRGFCEVIGYLVSYALQYGVPLSELAPKLTGHHFPPAGPTSNPKIPECSSLIDYVFRWLTQEFADGPKAAAAEAAVCRRD